MAERRRGIRILAAEFALGLVDGAERASLGARILNEPNFARAVAGWRQLLGGLDAGFAPVAAPAGALSAIERRLFGTAATAEARGGFWDNLFVWRGIAGAMAAVAVVAVGLNLVRPAQVVPDLAVALDPTLVAALRAEGSDVSFIALYDATAGTVRLTTLSGAAVPQMDFELWAIQGTNAPVSMGVIPIGQRIAVPVDAGIAAGFAEGTVLAVSLEPAGGSTAAGPPARSLPPAPRRRSKRRVSITGSRSKDKTETSC